MHLYPEAIPGWGAAAAPPPPVWRATLPAFLLVPVSFYCFWGHASGRAFPLVFFLPTLILVLAHLAALTVVINGSGRAGLEAGIEAIAQLSTPKLCFLRFSVIVEVALVVCAIMHYVAHGKQ